MKDLYKMEVYRPSALRNRWKPAGALGPDGVAIPENIIAKAPTAELRENQKDQDCCRPTTSSTTSSNASSSARCGSARWWRALHLETVKKIERLLYLAEYKRRQAAPGAGDAQDRPRPPLPDRHRFRDQGQVAFKADEALQQAAGKARSEAYEA